MASSSNADEVFSENEAYTKAEAAVLFVQLWKKLSYHSIMSAWDADESESSDSEQSSSESSFSNEEEESE